MTTTDWDMANVPSAKMPGPGRIPLNPPQQELSTGPHKLMIQPHLPPRTHHT
jgi:hypothetical protein